MKLFSHKLFQASRAKTVRGEQTTALKPIILAVTGNATTTSTITAVFVPKVGDRIIHGCGQSICCTLQVLFFCRAVSSFEQGDHSVVFQGARL